MIARVCKHYTTLLILTYITLHYYSLCLQLATCTVYTYISEYYGMAGVQMIKNNELQETCTRHDNRETRCYV